MLQQLAGSQITILVKMLSIFLLSTACGRLTHDGIHSPGIATVINHVSVWRFDQIGQNKNWHLATFVTWKFYIFIFIFLVLQN